jgi:hypothetical protein
MTEPDEALLWARERAAKWQDEGGGLAGPSYRKGNLDGLLGEELEGYRAGQAASAARIKALEGALSDLFHLCENANEGAFRNGVTDHSNTMDEGEVIAWRFMDNARALLKEADQ